MRLVWGEVVSVDRAAEGIEQLNVVLDGGSRGRAVAYPRLSGECQVGDRVLLNTTACDLTLGTGGLHFVVAREGLGEGVAFDAPSGGHVMKLRYTPLQLDVMSVEAPESPHHEAMASATSLGATPVVCCGLHSQVPLVAAAIKQADPHLRVVYCMTDHAALPFALSGIMRQSTEAGLVDASVSCGQAFGATIEAVNLHSGMLAAKHVLGADVIIVAIGPGVVGTSTPFGHGGVAQGEAINAVAALGGRAVACLRVSFADKRERHRGVSHHTLAALTSIALAPALVPIPALDDNFLNTIREQLHTAGVWERHVEAPGERQEAPPHLRGVEVTTMGRGPADDPAFFSAAYASGYIASDMALGIRE